MELLELKDVTFIYKGHKAEDSKIIFNHFNLSLELGKIYALTGGSGVGKSTFAHLIAGHLVPDSGKITLMDRIVTKPLKDIFIVHQENDLFPWLNVVDQLKFTGAKDKEIHELLAVFKLQDSKHLYPFELSGGMKKRLALIRAELLKPKVLVLDETLASLDRVMIKEIMAEMVPIWRKNNQTVLLITHHLDEIKEYIDQVIRF